MGTARHLFALTLDSNLLFGQGLITDPADIFMSVGASTSAFVPICSVPGSVCLCSRMVVLCDWEIGGPDDNAMGELLMLWGRASLMGCVGHSNLSRRELTRPPPHRSIGP